MLGKLSHVGSRRYRDYVILQLSPIFIKMGQHIFYMESTTGHSFNLSVIALPCYARYCAPTVLFIDLASLKKKIGRGLMAVRAAENSAKERQIRNGNTSWRTSCSWTHPKELQAEQIGFWEWVNPWCVVGSADGWYNCLLGFPGPGEHRLCG